FELVGTFSNAADALKYLREEGDVDLVFCDIELPGLSGLEAARWLKKHTRKLVFITGHSDYALEAYGVYVSYFIVKPVTVTDLQELLEDLLGPDADKPPIQLKVGKLLLYNGGDKTHTPVLPYDVVKLIQD